MGPNARTALLFLFMMGLFVLVGMAIGAYYGTDWLSTMIVFMIFALVVNLFSYFYSSKMVLWSYRARILDRNEYPHVHAIVERIAQNAGLPAPKLALIDSITPNAFATGRNPENAVVAVTTGILSVLDEKELEGVLSHEMAHVKDRDILIMTIAATLAGAISIALRFVWYGMIFNRRRDVDGVALAILLVAMITAPIAALLIRLAVSRQREFKADEQGGYICGHPEWLADALEKLEYRNIKRPMQRGNPATASMFIVNPFRGSKLTGLFSTHPPTEERVKRLRKQAEEMLMGPVKSAGKRDIISGVTRL